MKKRALGAAVLTGFLLVSSAAPAAPSARPAPNRGRAIDLLAEGQAREAAGDRKGAIALYLESVQLAPSPAGYYHLGHAYAESGDRENARRYLSLALEMNPHFELARVELSTLSRGRKKTQRGGGAEQASRAGGTGNGAQQVVPVAQEFPAAAALAEQAANAPIDVDAMQREFATLRSLRRPDGLGEPAPSYPTSASPAIDPLIPPAPAIAGAGAPPVVVPPVPHPTPAGVARNSLEPQVPAVIHNEDIPKIISYNAPPEGEAAASDAVGREVAVEAPRGVRATPEPGLYPGPAAPGEPVLPPPSADPTESGGFVADGGGAPSLAAAGGGRPTVADINAVAFGPEAQAQKPSTVFNSPTKVDLGTFAFHKHKGDTYRSAGRFADAANEYRTALRLNPADTEVRTLLAEMLGRAGQTESAEAQLEHAQTMAPDDPRVYYKQGNLYRDQQKYDLAIGSYLKALNLDPDDKYTLNNLGVVYMEKGDYAKAAARFKRVLDIDPKYANAILNLGILYDDHLGDDQLALKYYQQYLALPDVPRKGEVQRWIEAIQRDAAAKPAP